MTEIRFFTSFLECLKDDKLVDAIVFTASVKLIIQLQLMGFDLTTTKEPATKVLPGSVWPIKIYILFDYHAVK
jgi:hypothetical protein